MNIFLNGDFKIQNSWNDRSKSKQSARQHNRPPSSTKPTSKDKSSLVNAAEKLIAPDALDTFVADKIYRDFQSQIPPPPSSSRSVERKGSKSKEVVPTPKFPPRQRTNADDDLISSMANRLKQVEMTNNSLRNELKEKNIQIQKLKGQNIFFKGMRENSQMKFQQFQEIKKKNESLEKKVQQMQEYLKKYGMKWVGESLEGKLDKQKLKKDISNSKNNYRLPSQIDFSTIQRRLEQLNAGLHAQGQGTQIYNENGVHKFRKAQPLSIAFFAEGIAIKGMNFYPYKSKESLRILSDILDGYFPYVLKQRFPNGVFLKPVDMIGTKYSQYEKQSGEAISSLGQINKNQFKPMSKEQFLNKLPAQIIKNGKVIPIRQGINKIFENGLKQDKENGQPNTHQHDSFEQIDGCIVFKTKEHRKVNEGGMNSEQVCTLKVRTENGKVCILELERSEKIKQVYAWMRKVVKQKFVVMSNFPKRSYDENEEQNLQDLGLYPNALLHLQIIK